MNVNSTVYAGLIVNWDVPWQNISVKTRERFKKSYFLVKYILIPTYVDISSVLNKMMLKCNYELFQITLFILSIN